MCDLIYTYWRHNNHLHFDILATSVSFCYMRYCHGNSSVQMLINLETKSTPSYTIAFQTCPCTNLYLIWTKNNQYPIYWFASKYTRYVILTQVRINIHGFVDISISTCVLTYADRQFDYHSLHTAILSIWGLGFPVPGLLSVGWKMYHSCMYKA